MKKNILLAMSAAFLLGACGGSSGPQAVTEDDVNNLTKAYEGTSFTLTAGTNNETLSAEIVMKFDGRKSYLLSNVSMNVGEVSTNVKAETYFEVNEAGTAYDAYAVTYAPGATTGVVTKSTVESSETPMTLMDGVRVGSSTVNSGLKFQIPFAYLTSDFTKEGNSISSSASFYQDLVVDPATPFTNTQPSGSGYSTYKDYVLDVNDSGTLLSYTATGTSIFQGVEMEIQIAGEFTEVGSTTITLPTVSA